MIECIQARDHIMAQKVGEAIDFTSSLWGNSGKLVGARRDDFVRATSAYSDAWTLVVAMYAGAGEGNLYVVGFIFLANDLNDPVNTIYVWFRFYKSEEHTSELQSRSHLVCRLLHGKK